MSINRGSTLSQAGGGYEGPQNERYTLFFCRKCIRRPTFDRKEKEGTSPETQDSGVFHRGEALSVRSATPP